MIRQLKNEEHGQSGVKIDRYGWVSRGDKGQLGWVNKNILRVDDTYQRKPNMLKALNIAREWSWVGCGVIVCNKRGDELVVMDGQHRVLAAMKRNDIQELPVIIFNAGTIKEEAEGFLDTNVNRQPLKTMHKFNAMLTAEDKCAIAANNLISKHGITMVDGQGGANCTKSINTVLNFVKQDQEKADMIVGLASELCTQEQCFMSQTLLDGLWAMNNRLKTPLPDTKLRDRIKKVGAKQLETAARKAAAFFGAGGARSWATGMIEEINKGLRYKFEEK